ncbi:MAG: polynucleotide adenylyltransferase [Pseudomonadota bacterium]
MSLRPSLPAPVNAIAETIAQRGGRTVLVGGLVRDMLLGAPSKDVDLEIYGLTLAELEVVLAGFGEVIQVGRAFGVLRVKGLDVDFSIPRRDSKTGRGHRGFIVDLDPGLTFAEAARRRDLTINSLGLDVLSHELLDPHGGQADLEAGRLRATDAGQFSEDPLRGLRVAQFAARFEMAPDAELHALSAALDLTELPVERIWGEMLKLLAKGRRPSFGFDFLRSTGLIRFFPELEALIGVPQDPQWHPEGPVWEHTLMVLDEAAKDVSDDAEADLIVRFGALCHDLGKPAVTVREDGRVRSPDHEAQGVAPTESFMARIGAPGALTMQVSCIVRHHLAPAHFAGTAKDRGFRRLARKLQAGGINPELLYRVARADCFGRTTDAALARRFPAGDAFLERMQSLQLADRPVVDVVQGRHLIARGMQPGPHFREFLDACRDVQDDTGWSDPDRILDQVLMTAVSAEKEDRAQ